MDKLTTVQRSAIMRRVRSKNTGVELVVRRLVYGMGYRYLIHRKELPGKPDLVFNSKKKVIFVHGCFWHGHVDCNRARVPASNHEYWSAKIARNSERNRDQIAMLSASGWDALILWECELRNSASVQTKIKEFLDG